MGVESHLLKGEEECGFVNSGSEGWQAVGREVKRVDILQCRGTCPTDQGPFPTCGKGQLTTNSAYEFVFQLVTLGAGRPELRYSMMHGNRNHTLVDTTV